MMSIGRIEWTVLRNKFLKNSQTSDSNQKKNLRHFERKVISFERELQQIKITIGQMLDAHRYEARRIGV